MTQKKILIVDDEESLRKLTRLLLASRGYLVKEACDGVMALAFVESDKPDLVLLDIMMPGINGFEVCKSIKGAEATRHIPVIMLTAKKSREDMAKAEQAGANQFITKPFKSAYLLESIKQFLCGVSRDDLQPLSLSRA